MKSELRFALFSSVVLFGVVLILDVAQAAHWPSWRGPSGDSVSAEKTVPQQWSATNNVRWRVDLPDRGNSSPVVWGNKVFVTQAIEKEHRRTLMCFDRANGKLLWQSGVTYAEPEDTHETNPYCAASPVTDGERVVVTYASAGVYCYDFNGKEVWRRDLGKQVHSWGNASSPVIHGDICFIYHGPGDKSVLYALNKKTGETIWQYAEPVPKQEGRTDGFRGNLKGMTGTFSTPMLIKAGQRDELVMTFPNQIVSFEPRTGKELWRCDGLNPLVYTSPLYGEGVIVGMGGFLGTTIAVKPGGEGDVTATHRLWQTERTKNRLGSGVIHQGHVYVLNTPGIAECIELATGKVVWEERVQGVGAKSESWSSMILVGDLIYILNQSGDTTILKASPKFEIVTVNTVKEPSNSTLAISNGELFIRTHEALWCIGDSKKSASVE